MKGFQRFVGFYMREAKLAMDGLTTLEGPRRHNNGGGH